MNLSLSLKFPFVKTISQTEIVKSNQQIPVTEPRRRSDTEGLSDRNVQSDMLQDWYLQLPGKIPPKQIDSILRMALAGNLWQAVQLTQRMRDTWPMFRKCEYELRAAVASSKFVVHPYTIPGKKPTKSAEEKADLVRRALDFFRPDRFADEDGVHGMIFDLTDAITNGISILELLWNENSTDPQGRPESVIRATGWVHPRNYAFSPDGRVGVAYAAESGAMSFSNLIRHEMMDNPNKFLVGKFKSKSGSPLGAGFMRPLAIMWPMVVYPRDFALNFAQKYGNPFLDVAYQASLSSNQTEVDKFERLARQAVNQGYFVHPDSAKLEIGKEHQMSGDNAQLAIMRLADYSCQMLMLGQTLTTDVADSGSRALGDVHENVRQERLEEFCKWIARVLTEQFAESLLAVNYGKDYVKNPERPTVEADMTRPMTATQQADYLQKISNTRIPLPVQPVFKHAGMEVPAPGDEVLMGGQLVILEESVTPTEKREQEFQQQLEQQMTVAQLQAPPDDANEPKDKVLNARAIQAALSTAEPDDVAELENLVTAAERAPHNNGETKTVHDFVVKILRKR